MFSQVVATGEDSWAPSIGSLPPDVGRIQLEDREEQRNDIFFDVRFTSIYSSIEAAASCHGQRGCGVDFQQPRATGKPGSILLCSRAHQVQDH
ncbi:hypothetical protein KSP40_PGU012682 [Platanthera guangdongensis]|uniref:Uncharacterized protein n=1 Tax=Platanthera guangdongensis TaxID=2320717 RepID=A0ABR2MXX2_9ASPA